MFRCYLVLFIYIQITHQFNLQQDNSVLLDKFRSRNRRQFNNQDQDRIIFCDKDEELRDCYDLQRSLQNVITNPPQWFTDNFNKRRSSTIRPTTSTVAIPGMGTLRSGCEAACRTTPEYNPVCGDNNMTYNSINRLKCAQSCGKRVKLNHLGACTRIPPV